MARSIYNGIKKVKKRMPLVKFAIPKLVVVVTTYVAIGGYMLHDMNYPDAAWMAATSIPRTQSTDYS